MKTTISILLALIAVVATLNVMGKFFIREVVQEATFTEPAESIHNASLAKPAPYFELQDLADNKIKSSDFLGTPVVLTFWTTWNPVAADQIKILDDYMRKKDDRNLFKIVTISGQEDKSVVINFINRGGYEIDVLLDESGAITETYQARNLPATYFLDGEGILREVFIGILSEKQLVEKVEALFK